MAIFYPRKQTVLIFIVCIGIIVALIAYKDAQNPQDIGTEATSMSLRIQSDNDRSDMLATTSPTSIDWQKQFLAGGPTAAIKLNSKPGTSQVKDAPLTLTDRISQDLFAQFMTAHQAGLDSDPDVINGISQRFIDHVSQAATPVQYTLRDISIINDSSQSSIAAYAQRLMTILKDLPTQDAAQIANDTLSAGQSSSLSEIDPIIAAYQGILISLKSLPVPQKLAQNHLNLLNGIATTLSNDQALRKVDADPVQGLSALSLYVSGLQQISTAVSGLQSGFDSANVVLTVAASTNNK